MTRPTGHGAAFLTGAALVAVGLGALATEAPGVAVRAATAAHGVDGSLSAAPGEAGGGVRMDGGAGTGTPGGGGAWMTGADALPGRETVLPRWQWPLSPPPALVRPFRAPLSRYGRGHRGIDLAAKVGAPVLAVESGRVRHAGPVAGRGTVTVQHHDGLLSTYEPIHPRVRAGDIVAAGAVLGTVQQVPTPGHCGTGTCLHLGARRLGSYLDPLPLLSKGRLGLLPLSRGD